MMRHPTLNSLPEEILLNILSQVNDPKTFTELSQVSHSFHELTYDNKLWKRLYLQRWHNIIDPNDINFIRNPSSHRRNTCIRNFREDYKSRSLIDSKLMDKLNNVIIHPTTRYQTLQRLYSKYNKKLIPKLMDICNYKTNHHFLQAILSSSSSSNKNIDISSIDLSSINSNHYLIRDLNTTEISRIRNKFYKVNRYKNLIGTKDDFYRLNNLSKISYSEKLFRIIRHNDAIEIFNELLTNPKYKEKPSSINDETDNDLDVEDAVFAFSCFDQRHYELLIYRQLVLTLVPVIVRNSMQSSCLKNPTQGIHLLFNTFVRFVNIKSGLNNSPIILNNNFILRVYAGKSAGSSACLVAIMFALAKQFNYKVDVVSFPGTFMLRVYDPSHAHNNENDLNVENEHDDSIDNHYVYCEFGGFGFKSYTIHQLRRRLHQLTLSFKRKYIEPISIFRFIKDLLHKMDFETLASTNHFIGDDKIQHRNNDMLELLVTKLIIHKYNRDIGVNNNNNNNNVNHNVNMDFVFRHLITYDYSRRYNGVDFNQSSLLTPFNVTNNTARILTLTNYICEAFPESSKVLERLINAPLNSIYPKTHLIFKTLSHIDKRRRDSLSQSPFNIKPKYYIGQILKHDRYEHTGIVLSWSVRKHGYTDHLSQGSLDHTYSMSYDDTYKPEIYYELILEDKFIYASESNLKEINLNNLNSPDSLNFLEELSNISKSNINIGIYFEKFNPGKGYFEMSVDMIRKYPDDYNHWNNNENDDDNVTVKDDGNYSDSDTGNGN